MSSNEQGGVNDAVAAEQSRSANREALAAIVDEGLTSSASTIPSMRKSQGQSGYGFSDVLKDSLARKPGVGERQTALVPEASISGRALVIVIIIMTFLASLAAGTVELIASASSSWSDDIAKEMTIQVRPRSGRDIEADVAKAAELARGQPGIGQVRIYTRVESERLLEPWLGTTLPLDQLPVPRILTLSLGDPLVDPRRPKAANADLDALRKVLAEHVPTATLDDHRQWSSRLATMARSLVLVGLMILLLVLVATGLAIAFATRGAMAGTREIINVLHLVGAEDRFIADEFQRHFLMLGLRGGLIGSLLAILSFALAGYLSSRWIATPQGEQIEALFGTFGLGMLGYGAIILIAIIVSALTAIVTRLTVYRNLRGVD